MNTVRRVIASAAGCFILLCPFIKVHAQCTPPGTVTVVQPTNCDSPNGSITIGSPAPLANYLFSKDDGVTFQANNVFTNLSPGTYYLRSKEIATGCISTRVVQTLNNPAAAITTALINNTNCAGTPNGSINFTAPASGYTYSINGGTTFQAGSSFANLAAGTYNLAARNVVSGCISTSTVVINNSFVTPATPTATPVNPTGCNNANGQITANGPAPLANFSFSSDGGSTFQPGNVFTGLTAGTYRIVARSNATGCVSAALTVTLNGPAVPAPAATSTGNTNCTGTPNGTITFTSPAPLANFTFSIDGGLTFQPGPVFSNLAAGTYRLVAKNTSTGCTSPVANEVVANSTVTGAAPAVTTVNPANCSSPNGSITVTNPVSGVLYSIDGGTTFQPGNVFNGLAPGAYSVVVKNTTTGCVSLVRSVTLTGPAVATPVATSINNSSCSGSPNGSITITSPLGANFEYSLNGGVFQASPVFSGLTGANYTVVTRNTTTGCISAVRNVTLTNTSPVFAPTVNTINPTTCTPGNGQITVTGPLPIAGYTFSIDGGTTFQASNVFAGLTGGTYQVMAKSNSTGCTSQALTTTLVNPTVAGVATTLVANTMCVAPYNGSVTFTGPAPTANYSFSINGGLSFQAGTVFSNLNAGTYQTMAKNNSTGCVSSITARTITSSLATVPAPITSNVNVTVCSTPDGSITITGPPALLTGHSYSIDNGINFQAGAVFSNLPGGNYKVRAKNNTTGCVSAFTSVGLTAPVVTAPVISKTDDNSCNGQPNGSITITSPLAGVSYSIDSGATYHPGNVFSNLSFGAYYVIIKDLVSGCNSAAVGVAINGTGTNLANPVVSLVHPTSCIAPNGSITITSPAGASFEYSINGGLTYQAGTTFTGLAGGGYPVKVRNTSTGCSSVTVPIILNNPVVSPTATITNNTNCTGTGNGAITFTGPLPLANFSFSIDSARTFQANPLFSNLNPGTYLTIAKDNSTGCLSAAIPRTVATAAAPVPSPTSSLVNNTSCISPNGSITVLSPSPVSSYSYSIDGGQTFFASNLFSALAGGTYSVVAMLNSTGCKSNVVNVTLLNPAVPVPVLSVTQITNCLTPNGAVTVTSPPQGTGYLYSINNGLNYQSSGLFSGLTPGTYQVVVRNNNSACVSAITAFTINPPTGVPGSPTTVSGDPTNCLAPDGFISITGPAPLTNFSFSIDNGITFSSAPVFNGLQPGTYQAVVRNIASGCLSASTSVTLDPPAVTIPAATGTNTTACNLNDGSISFTVALPAALSSYRFSIDGGTTFQASPVFTNLAPGTYQPVSKLVSSGCNYPLPSIAVSSPVLAAPSTTISNNTNCTGTPNGSITVIAPVGPGTEYSIDNGTTWQSSVTFNNLMQGQYSVTARNTNTGCLSPASLIYVETSAVYPPTPLVTADGSNSCVQPNGTITFTDPVPLSNYTFSITGGASYQASPVFPGLSTGLYFCLAKDKITGCVSKKSAVVTVGPSPAFPAVSVSSTAPSSCSSFNGTVSFTDPQPFSSYEFSINGGTSYQSSPVFTGIGPGTYNLIVRDLVSGCTNVPSPSSLIFSTPAVPAPLASVIDATSCTPSNGQIAVISPTPTSNYRFSINGGTTFQNSTVFNNISPGTYNVVSQLISTGCISSAVPVFVNGPVKAAPSYTQINPSSCMAADGSITVTGPLPLSDYTFSKDNGATFQAGNVFTGLPSGLYNIVAKNTITGCITPAVSVNLICAITQTVTKTAYKNGGSTPAGSVAVNDTVNYVIQVAGGFPSANPSLTDVMSINQQYIANSARADNWTLNGGTGAWFGIPGNGTTTALYNGPLTVTQDGGFMPEYGQNTYVALNTITGTTSSSVNFSGGGDGMRPVYWRTNSCQEKVLVKNHHNSNSPKCWNLTTNTSCQADLAAISGANQNYYYTLSSGWSETINNKVYTVDVADGNHGVVLGRLQVNCIDLNPAGNPVYCSGYPKAFPTGVLSVGQADTLDQSGDSFNGIKGYDAVNDRLYFVADSVQKYNIIYGIQIGTGTITQSAPLLLPSHLPGTSYNPFGKAVFLTTNRLLIESGTFNVISCLDISSWPSVKDCNPSNAPGVFTGYSNNVGSRVSPLLDKTGTVTGFCTYAGSCYDLNGNLVPNPPGYTPSSEMVTDYIVNGTRVITMKGKSAAPAISYIYCYDFATNTSCGTTPNIYDAVLPYSFEWRSPGKCILVYGDAGELQQWGIEEGGFVQNSSSCFANSCQAASNILPDASARFCGPQTNNIQYRRIKISGLPPVHSGTIVTVKCGGTILATYPVPPDANGFEQDITGLINPATCPNPEITVSFSSLPLSTNVVMRTEVIYDNAGRFPEICYDAKVILCDGAPVTNNVTISGPGVTTVLDNVSLPSDCITLPVKLTDFTATSGSCSVLFSWSTAEETDFDHFELERSVDGGRHYTVITSLQAAGSGTKYHFKEESVVQGRNIYRLKMVDKDGKAAYSKVLVVMVNCEGKQAIVVYPNPVNDKTTITGLRKGDRVELYNASGQLLLSRFANNSQEQIDLSAYANGIYAIKISNQDSQLTTIKVVKQ